MTNNTKRALLYAILFVALFVVAQALMTIICVSADHLITGENVRTILHDMRAGTNGKLYVAISIASYLFTFLLFYLTKWSPISRHYLQTRPWSVVFWAALLALGLILPTEWVYEKVQLQMSESRVQMFESIMKEPWGYIALGLLAPIVEEMVFRGAILRKLLEAFQGRRAWIAIVLSALLFALAHGNIAQGIHAFIIGLVFGWMYMRTGSIIPGVVFHWVNNTVAYVMFNLMPQMSDGQLIDFFHGSNRTMVLGLIFSMCICVPALLQLNIRMKKE